ncbi:MAG: DUF2963 domain-containing protein [Candidatus Phytoplasma pruni]|uniref:DUF2963 domain-containing protein n=1 Tax=Milkweed yellows phytoplasma TaxID=208434 RepID=UPI00036CAA34|nr:DUF2963 domain-containing protein [Milkweed yellows phytoplasma]
METNKKQSKIIIHVCCFILLIVISVIISKIILPNDESAFKKVDNSTDKLHYNLDDTKVEFKQNFDKIDSKLNRCVTEANKQDSKPVKNQEPVKEKEPITQKVPTPVKPIEPVKVSNTNKEEKTTTEANLTETKNPVEEVKPDEVNKENKQNSDKANKTSSQESNKEIFYYQDGKTIRRIIEKDPQTGNLIKETGYVRNEERQRLAWCLTYKDPNTRNKIKRVTHPIDYIINYKYPIYTFGEYYIIDYDPQTGKRLKATFYYSDNETISLIMEQDPQTGNLIKETGYLPKDKRIDSFGEIDLKTSEWITTRNDNHTDYIIDYDPQTGKERRKTFYNGIGTINRIIIPEYDPQTGNRIKDIAYRRKLKKIGDIPEYDLITGQCIKEAFYSDEKKTDIQYFTIY